jgi:hypothetical protein
MITLHLTLWETQSVGSPCLGGSSMFGSKTAYSQVPAEIELERLHARQSDANDEAGDSAEAQQDEEDRHMPLTANREGHWCGCTAATAAATATADTATADTATVTVFSETWSMIDLNALLLQVLIRFSQRKQCRLNNILVQYSCAAMPLPVQST